MSIPFTIAGMPVNLMAENALTRMARASLSNDRVLIILQMHGGNDGLNSVIPVADYDLYYSRRANIAIPAKNSVRNPGVNNTDLALSKRFLLKSDKRYMTFRWEAYNAFNHTQYSGLNTTARYDLTTGAQTNALFGQVSSTRAPRIMQGSLRFTF